MSPTLSRNVNKYVRTLDIKKTTSLKYHNIFLNFWGHFVYSTQGVPRVQQSRNHESVRVISSHRKRIIRRSFAAIRVIISTIKCAQTCNNKRLTMFAICLPYFCHWYEQWGQTFLGFSLNYDELDVFFCGSISATATTTSWINGTSTYHKPDASP